MFARTTLRIHAYEGLLCDERSVLRGVKWEHIGRPDWVTVALGCAFDANEDEIEDSSERIEVLHICMHIRSGSARDTRHTMDNDGTAGAARYIRTRLPC